MDLHAWITQQVDRVADEAHEAAGGAGSEHWRAAEEASCECCVNLRTKDGGLLCTPDARYVDFMATHDPAAALRRCEADRRILARHKVDPTAADSPTFATACDGCRSEWVQDDCEPLTANINDCPELLDLAHAHGITPEILAGLDRPQPPESKPPTGRRLGLANILATPPITTSDVPEALRGPRWKP